MGSISGEGSGVKAKAIFAETAERVRKVLAKRIGEEVGNAIEDEIDKMLGREAYVQREAVWPETDHAEVIAWRLADKEDERDWLAFLS